MRSIYFRLWLPVAAWGFFVVQPLCAQSSAQTEQKCQGSTVDDLGDAKAARAARSFLADLQSAIKANDREKIAGMVSYPMNFIRNGSRLRIRSRESLLARYEMIFDDRVRKAIEQQSSRCLFGNDQGEMIGRGEVWFSQMQDGSVKIITVNPSAGS